MYSVLLLLVAGAIRPLSAFGQAPSKPSAPRESLLEGLDREARVSTPEGVHVYSQHLVQMLVGNSAGPVYATSLTGRLAQAEFTARHGKRKLISEADIAQAFNVLMKETRAPDSFVADKDAVHRNRIAFENSLPAMISYKSNGSYCNPGEAVFVVEMMIENVDRPLALSPNFASKSAFAAINPPVRMHLEQFYASHSLSEVTEVFNRLFNVFQS